MKLNPWKRSHASKPIAPAPVETRQTHPRRLFWVGGGVLVCALFLIARWSFAQTAPPASTPRGPHPQITPELALWALQHPKEFNAEYEKTLNAEQIEVRAQARFAIAHPQEAEARADNLLTPEQRLKKALATFDMADPQQYQAMSVPLRAIADETERSRAMEAAIPAKYKVAPSQISQP